MVWLKRDLLTSLPAKRPLPANTATAVVNTVRPPAGGTAKAGVLEGIRKLIAGGYFAPGSCLPPERTLAVQFGVGRPAVREAIKTLSGLGILESRRGSGTLVKSVEPDVSPSLTQRYGFRSPRRAGGPEDPGTPRRLARGHARQPTAVNGNEEARQVLEAQHDRDWKLVPKLDLDLHAAIFRGVQNPVFVPVARFPDQADPPRSRR